MEEFKKEGVTHIDSLDKKIALVTSLQNGIFKDLEKYRIKVAHKINQFTTSIVEATELAADDIRSGVDTAVSDHLIIDSMKKILNPKAP